MGQTLSYAFRQTPFYCQTKRSKHMKFGQYIKYSRQQEKSCKIISCKWELILGITIIAGFSADMVNGYTCVIVPLQPSPAMAYFSPLPSLMASVSALLHCCVNQSRPK